MITRIDVGEALAVLTGNAPDKTPASSEIVIQAWCDYFDGYLQWTGDDLAVAVHEYCKRPRERLVQPVDLGAIIKAFRQDAIERMDPDERDAWADLGGRRSERGSDGVRRDHYGYRDKTPPDPAPYPQDWNPNQRLAASWAETRWGCARIPPLDPSTVEHPPGRPCISGGCGKASTFGDYCAKHYVLHGAYSRRGPTAVPAGSLADLFERTADEIL